MTTAAWYGLGLKHAMSDVDVTADTIKAAILDNGYTPNQDTDEFWDDVSANEVSGTGYSAGGDTVTVTVDYTTGTNTVALKVADPVVWADSTITGQYVVFYKDTGTAGTSALLGFQDAGEDITSSGGDWTFTPNAGGILNAVAGAPA